MAPKTVIPGSQQIDQAGLKNWVKWYGESITGEKNETRSCLVELNTLNDFMKRINKFNKGNASPINAIRIYFVRCNGRQEFLKLSDGVTSQATVAIVPAQEYKIIQVHDVEARDCLDDTVSWIVPGYSNETSGLCPPNCNGTIGKGG